MCCFNHWNFKSMNFVLLVELPCPKYCPGRLTMELSQGIPWTDRCGGSTGQVQRRTFHIRMTGRSCIKVSMELQVSNFAITGKRSLQKSLWILYICTHKVDSYKIAQRVYKWCAESQKIFVIFCAIQLTYDIDCTYTWTVLLPCTVVRTVDVSCKFVNSHSFATTTLLAACEVQALTEVHDELCLS
jgi:hypothetical protein